MRLLTPWLVGCWRDRMLNIHPALLPSFRGLHTHERALAEGVKIHGATVHFVSSEVDAGPIVVQAAVPVLPDDTPDTLSARVLAEEHRIYPLALKLVASGRARVDGARALVKTDAPAPGAMLWPSLF
jgi:phosphoribosylglycinamide formyltransferase-1